MSKHIGSLAEQIQQALDDDDYIERSDIRSMLVQHKQLLEVLQAVEWAEGDEDNYCPCCLANKSDGHETDCKIGVALKAAGVEVVV